MEIKNLLLGEVFDFLPKSKHKAGDGLKVGEYPFFTSSQQQSKWFDEANYKQEAIILGTGGMPSVHCAENFSTSTDVFVMSPSRKEILTKYVYYFFLCRTDILEKGFKGAGLKHLSREYTKKIQIPFPIDKDGDPDLAEQKRIVTILAEAEGLKKKRAEADKKIDRIIPEIFTKMFSDPLKDTVKLGDYVDFLTSGSRGWAKYYSKESGSKFIRIQNVKNAKLNFTDVQFVLPPDTAEAKRTKVKSGDLLVSITADLGRTAVVDHETATKGAYINQHLALVRLNDQFNPLFVANFLETEFGKNQFLKYGQAAAKKGLNFDSVKSLRIPKPPISLQDNFADRVKEIEIQKEKQKQSAEKIDLFFQALLNKSFPMSE